jgi:hypothetical protein
MGRTDAWCPREAPRAAHDFGEGDTSGVLTAGRAEDRQEQGSNIGVSTSLPT